MKFIKKYWADILLFIGIILYIDPIATKYCYDGGRLHLTSKVPCVQRDYIVWEDVGIILVILGIWVVGRKLINKKLNI